MAKYGRISRLPENHLEKEMGVSHSSEYALDDRSHSPHQAFVKLDIRNR